MPCAFFWYIELWHVSLDVAKSIYGSKGGAYISSSMANHRTKPASCNTIPPLPPPPLVAFAFCFARQDSFLLVRRVKKLGQIKVYSQNGHAFF